jgi:hypothetical protein
MSRSQRVGLWLCLAVPALFFAEAVAWAVWRLHSPPIGLKEVGETFGAVAVTLTAAGVLAGGLYHGRPGYRRLALVIFVVFGLVLIWLARLRMTFGYPDAISPEELAEMQAVALRDFWIVALMGAFNILMGVSLLLPPVGQYFQAQQERRERACQGGARDMLREARAFLDEGDKEAAVRVLGQLEARLQDLPAAPGSKQSLT